MLQPDSLVLDLIFQGNAQLDPESLVAALGGPEVLKTRKVLDPDMQDPRFELEVSPSMPFRRQDERRLLIIDDSVAPMRADPRTDPLVPIDLRPEKERLIQACEKIDVRLGRLFALGSWGDAVIVARSARDLRAICLISWALDPTTGVDGKRRASRLTQAEFEEKLLAYDKRLDELSEQEILANLGPVNFERRGDLLVVDVLENDGTWDLRRSIVLEKQLASIERFSTFPGAPASPRAAAPAPTPTPAPAAAAPPVASPAAAPAAPAAPPAAPRPPLALGEVDGRLVLVFPPERFDLDLAAAIGKRDWGAVLAPTDPIAGAVRDRIHREGAGFVAPLEFLSEVFVEGRPLTKALLAQQAEPVAAGARGLEVHYPRFGPVLLLDVEGRGRFISSELGHRDQILALLP
jgi:hypothetical protein